MIKQVYVCDRCGEEIKGHIYQVRALVRNEDGDHKNALDNQEKMHLCEKCMLEIMDGIYPDNKKPEIKKEEKKEEKKAVHKKPQKAKKIIGIEKNVGTGYAEPNLKGGIDIGKVLALSDAGRSDEWIADEMGVTTSDITAILDR